MNKVAIVTGSSKGIGKSIIEKLSANNYNVVINYNTDFNSAIEIQNELKTKSLVIKCDVSNEDEVKEMVTKTINEFGHIDLLVNNAGICNDTLFEDKLVDSFRKILDVNLIGTYLVSKYVGEYMMHQKSGKIINIASTNGIDTYYPESCDYDASKAGVISLTHNLAKHYAPFVIVNAICPGWINTDMNKELDQEFVNDENKKILLHRFGNSNEIANVVNFLASDECSYINNTIIRIDGGKNE